MTMTLPMPAGRGRTRSRDNRMHRPGLTSLAAKPLGMHLLYPFVHISVTLSHVTHNVRAGKTRTKSSSNEIPDPLPKVTYHLMKEKAIRELLAVCTSLLYSSNIVNITYIPLVAFLFRRIPSLPQVTSRPFAHATTAGSHCLTRILTPRVLEHYPRFEKN